MSSRRICIDFRPSRGHEITALVYTVLKHHSAKQGKGGKAAFIVREAYKNYDPAESVQTTNMIDFATTAKAFVNEYKIGSKEDILSVIMDEPLAEDIELMVPDEKTFSFSEDEKTSAKLLDTLDGIRFRDRGTLIATMVYQYFAHGHDEYYNHFAAVRLLDALKSEYIVADLIGTKKFNTLISFIECAAAEEMAKYSHKEPESVSSDELRAFMGVKVKN